MRSLTILALISTPAIAQEDASIAARDKLVATVGEEARAFIKEFGSPGFYALRGLDTETARKLVTFAKRGGPGEKGGLDGIAHPSKVMGGIAASGDRGATWVMTNAALLSDPEYADMFASDPKEFAAGYKDIHKEVDRWRASPLRPFTRDWRYQAGAGAVGLIVLVVAARVTKRKRGYLVPMGGP